MIPRTLVPPDAHLSTAAANTPSQRRRPTALDERTLVPSMLPLVVLDGKSNIPTNLPLQSIAARVVVPRDINREAYSVVEDTSAPLQPTELDSRITVPQGAAPAEITPISEIIPTELIDPDIFLTGEVNLLASDDAEQKTKWSLLTRISGAIVFHAALIIFILLLPKIFPPREKTPEELEIARRQMTLLIPPGSFEMPRLEPERRQPPERIHVDPRTIKRVAPEVPKPIPAPTPPAPEPEKVVKSLPSAPTPQPSAQVPVPQQTVQQPALPVPQETKPALKFEAPDASESKPSGLIMPKVSPGRAIQDSAREATRGQAPRVTAGSGQQLPRAPGGSGGRPSAGVGPMEMLTPTDGVDFSSYLARVYTAVKQNWYAVMPESVNLGEQGKVSLTFKIMTNGSVPSGDPALIFSSGKEHLDRAAVSSIRSSNPFEPLPPAFKRPYIELRFTYYYNLPIDYAR